jgi:hypothetical protein
VLAEFVNTNWTAHIVACAKNILLVTKEESIYKVSLSRWSPLPITHIVRWNLLIHFCWFLFLPFLYSKYGELAWALKLTSVDDGLASGCGDHQQQNNNVSIKRGGYQQGGDAWYERVVPTATAAPVLNALMLLFVASLTGSFGNMKIFINCPWFCPENVQIYTWRNKRRDLHMFAIIAD